MLGPPICSRPRLEDDGPGCSGSSRTGSRRAGATGAEGAAAGGATGEDRPGAGTRSGDGVKRESREGDGLWGGERDRGLASASTAIGGACKGSGDGTRRGKPGGGAGRELVGGGSEKAAETSPVRSMMVMLRGLGARTGTAVVLPSTMGVSSHSWGGSPIITVSRNLAN